MTHPVAPPPIRSSLRAHSCFATRFGAVWDRDGDPRVARYMSPSVARSAEAPFQSRALMMRALLPSSSVNQSPDEHFDVWRHSLGVRSPLRRQRHLLRLREFAFS